MRRPELEIARYEQKPKALGTGVMGGSGNSSARWGENGYELLNMNKVSQGAGVTEQPGQQRPMMYEYQEPVSDVGQERQETGMLNEELNCLGVMKDLWLSGCRS